MGEPSGRAEMLRGVCDRCRHAKALHAHGSCAWRFSGYHNLTCSCLGFIGADEAPAPLTDLFGDGSEHR